MSLNTANGIRLLSHEGVTLGVFTHLRTSYREIVERDPDIESFGYSGEEAMSEAASRVGREWTRVLNGLKNTSGAPQSAHGPGTLVPLVDRLTVLLAMPSPSEVARVAPSLESRAGWLARRLAVEARTEVERRADESVAWTECVMRALDWEETEAGQAALRAELVECRRLLPAEITEALVRDGWVPTSPRRRR